VGKPEENRPLRTQKHRLVDNITMDLLETEWGERDWIDMAQDWDQWRTLVNVIMNLWVP
jgi:hypothetical protein